MNFDAILAQAEEKDKKLKLSFEDDWRWKQLEELNCAYFVQNQLEKIKKIENEYLSLKSAIDDIEYEVDFYYFEVEKIKAVQFELINNQWQQTLRKTITDMVDHLNKRLSVSVRLDQSDYEYSNFIGEKGIVPFLAAYFKEGDIRNAENAGYNKFKKEVHKMLRLDDPGRYDYCELNKNYFKRVGFVYYDEYPIRYIEGYERLDWGESKRNAYKLLLALFCFDRNHFVKNIDLSFFYGDDYQEYVPIGKFDMGEHMEKVQSVHFYKNSNVKITFRDEVTLHEFCNWLRDHHS